MNIRRFRVLHETSSTYTEIARECGVDPRTVKKYPAGDVLSVMPRPRHSLRARVTARLASSSRRRDQARSHRGMAPKGICDVNVHARDPTIP